MRCFNLRFFLAVAVGVSAGLLGWYMNQPPAPAAPPVRAFTPVKIIPVVPRPQSELPSLITQSIHLLQIHDLAGLTQTLMHPVAIHQLMQTGQATTPEEIAALLRQRMPDIDLQLAQMLQAMLQIQGQPPEISPDGNRATFKLDPPIGSQIELIFEKVDGFWYMH